MLQVVFKDKVVHIKGNYHTDVKLTVKQKYVTDIYKLASHFIPEDVVKTMKIYEIIRKVNLSITSAYALKNINFIDIFGSSCNIFCFLFTCFSANKPMPNFLKNKMNVTGSYSIIRN